MLNNLVIAYFINLPYKSQYFDRQILIDVYEIYELNRISFILL